MCGMGMKSVQSSFARFKDTLVYKEYGKWKNMFTCLFLLYILQAWLVGINQITKFTYQLSGTAMLI